MREEDIKSFEDAFFDALDLFNNQKWYEAHDAFEDIWNTLEGDERQVIQGILQVIRLIRSYTCFAWLEDFSLKSLHRLCALSDAREYVAKIASFMKEIVVRHSDDEFHERFEVKDQIGVGGKQMLR